MATYPKIYHLILIGILYGMVKGLMKGQDFQTLIAKRCYNKTAHDLRTELLNGQTVPLSNSIETFISLLERFERNYTNYKAEEIVESFLKRFAIDDIKREAEDKFRQRSRQKRRMDIILTVLNEDERMSFPEEAFTEDEKCALYFMLSHSVDKDFYPMPMEEEQGLLERGVVTLDNHPVHSIALGKVLLGILAGLKNPPAKTIQDILKEHKVSPIPSDIAQEIINPIYGITVGDTIGVEILRVVNKTIELESRKFGPNGKWNSSMCATKYYLTANRETFATYAQLRGAGDGLLLGLKIRELSSNTKSLSISNLLRMYYSERGVPGTINRYTYCNRWDLWGDINDDVIKESLNYVRLLNVYLDDGRTNDKELNDGIKRANDAFSRSREAIVAVINQNRCFVNDVQQGKLTCETPNDVFVVMDIRENDPELLKLQKETISLLATYLDIRLYGGTLSVFTNARSFGDRVLETVFYNTTSKGCVGCQLDWFKPQFASTDETYVFESLNKSLMLHEKEKEHLPGTPGKTVVYFNFGNHELKLDRNFKNAIWEIKNRHRDVQIFAVGSNRKLLEEFADSDKIITANSAEDIVSSLVDEICESPAILQYQDCYTKKSSLDDFSAYKGYVTPNRVQYWSMYPEYFLKSFKIRFEFTSTGNDIEVCYVRDSKKFYTRSEDCEVTSSNDQTVEFTIRNPCEKKTVYNCPPIHFAIKGKDTSGTSNIICLERECKAIDQIQFTIKHEGISCNGSYCLFSSLKVILVVLLLISFVRKNI